MLSSLPGHDPEGRQLVTSHLAYFVGVGCDATLGAGGSVFFASGKPAANQTASNSPKTRPFDTASVHTKAWMVLDAYLRERAERTPRSSSR
jgi:hypothetical protein